MIEYMAMVCAFQLNIVPATGGISEYYSPHMILTKQQVDYNIHCTVPFGAYVQSNQDNEPLNMLQPRTVDTIYLRPLLNFQGGHEVMDLYTFQVLKSRTVTECPITPLIVKAVEIKGEEQGMKNLKIKTKRKDIIHPANWIAGVDYDENYYEDASDTEYIEVQSDDDYDDDDDYYDDEVDPNEVEDLLADTSTNPIADDVDANDIEGNDQAQDESESENEENDNIDEDEEPTATRTGRKIKERIIFDPSDPTTFVQTDEQEQLEYCNNMCAQVSPNPELDEEYTYTDALLISRLMNELNEGISTAGVSFAQQYMLKRGLKVFGERGAQATHKELDQLCQRNCFTPISIKAMSDDERRKAQEALMFLTEKRSGTVKARMVYNGKPTREWLSREDAASPTAALESILLTATIDAKEGRDVMTADVPSAYIQCPIPEGKAGSDRIMMRISGVLADMLVELNPELYGPYRVYQRGTPVIYVLVLRAIYGMLESALIWYQKFRVDLEGIGFVFNPYDPCVANRIENGLQHTIRFHVDDCMSSHMDPRVNDGFLAWMNMKYGGALGDVKNTRGNKHDFLGMTFLFKDGKCILDMRDYVKKMLDSFPEEVKGKASTPAVEDLFAESTGNKLSEERAEQFHTTVAKGLFLCKRARPDIHPTIAVLCTRVKASTESEWNKLIRLMKYLNSTREDVLTLQADDLSIVKWWVDAAFAVHPDFKSHTGGIMSLGKGAIQSISRKQKLNTRSSTEAELVGADDVSVPILWTKLFLAAQGYDVEQNILYQDNKSTILLEENGKRSSSKRTRAFNIRYFFLTDQIEKGNLKVKYCPTGEMVADYMSKPLQGTKFEHFRKAIMGMD